jgi:tetratricopeptide (TPR) repeat protein
MSRLEQLEKLLEAEPNDVFLNFGLAMELAKGGRYQESLASFSRVVELDPDYVAAYFHKGKTLLAMGEKQAAKEALEIGVERAEAVGDRHAKTEMEELLAAM